MCARETRKREAQEYMRACSQKGSKLMSAFKDLIQKRYSVRRFSDKPVEQDKLDQVLEAGRLAPTATNAQPQRIYVVRSTEKLEALRSVTKMTYKAPVVLAVCYDADTVWHNRWESWRDYNSGEQDAAIVADHMQLMATELGLGTLWARGFDAKAVSEALGLPESSHLVMLLDLGYPAEESKPSAHHEDRKPLSETVVEL